MALADRPLARLPHALHRIGAGIGPARPAPGFTSTAPDPAPVGNTCSGPSHIGNRADLPRPGPFAPAASFFRWREAWNLGVASIDRDHRRLAALLDRIAHLTTQAPPAHAPHGLMRLLARLGQETRAHFAHEEALMRATDYSHLAGHKAEHDLLLAEYTLLVREVAERAGYLLADGALLRIRPLPLNPARTAAYQPATQLATGTPPAPLAPVPDSELTQDVLTQDVLTRWRPARFTLDLETLASLKAWFLGHLLDDDRHFAHYLRRMGLHAL